MMHDLRRLNRRRTHVYIHIRQAPANVTDLERHWDDCPEHSAFDYARLVLAGRGNTVKAVHEWIADRRRHWRFKKNPVRGTRCLAAAVWFLKRGVVCSVRCKRRPAGCALSQRNL
jgi:hypothetical protein